jgi:hypothetical protein
MSIQNNAKAREIKWWGNQNACRDACAACSNPYSTALMAFLCPPSCPAFDPANLLPHRFRRFHWWRNARTGYGAPRRWTPVRAQLFRVYLLRNWWTYLELMWLRPTFFGAFYALKLWWRGGARR